MEQYPGLARAGEPPGSGISMGNPLACREGEIVLTLEHGPMMIWSERGREWVGTSPFDSNGGQGAYIVN